MKHAVLLLAACLLSQSVPAQPAATIPFFPFCIDTHDAKKRSLEEQARMLKELGYSGVGHLWLDNVAERLQTLDAQGLKLYQITMQVRMEADKEPYPADKFAAALPLLKGRQVQILLIMSGMKSGDPAGIPKAVELVRAMADQARESGTELLLYPHTSDWIERVEFAAQVAREVNRPNVGVMFNLCHWLKVDGKQDLRTLLAPVMPLLRAVSVHGADTPESIHAGTGNWIQPLGQGSYNVGALLALLKELGYRGPVGLQCWGIPGDAQAHLAQSMAAWKAMQNQAR